jgi:calcineurin-like phosphoesterase family protein
LVAGWCSRVEPGDQVYVLGDFSFYNTERTNSILAVLPGQKFLIRGNHDRRKRLRGAIGWVWIKPYHEILVHDGPLAVLSHYPIEEWRGQGEGTYHLHGHSHGRRSKNRRLDVGVDPNDFVPISWPEVDQFLSHRPYERLRN